ncbi:phage protein [Pseudomonas phage PA02]|nr:phage protein [Pseudomonas phage PA02]
MTNIEKSELKKFFDHIVQADPFDHESFIYSRYMQRDSEDSEYALRATYVHGVAYIEGLVGHEGIKIKVFYNKLQGIQLWTYLGDEPRVDSWPYHQIDAALKEIFLLTKQ